MTTKNLESSSRFCSKILH